MNQQTFIFSTRLKVDLSSTFFRLSSTFIFFDRLFFVSTFIDFNRLFHQKSKSRSKIFIFCNPGVLVTGAKCSAVKSHSNSCTCSCFADTISRLLQFFFQDRHISSRTRILDSNIQNSIASLSKLVVFVGHISILKGICT